MVDAPEFAFETRFATALFPRSFLLFLDGVDPSCGASRNESVGGKRGEIDAPNFSDLECFSFYNTFP